MCCCKTQHTASQGSRCADAEHESELLGRTLPGTQPVPPCTVRPGVLGLSAVRCPAYVLERPFPYSPPLPENTAPKPERVVPQCL